MTKGRGKNERVTVRAERCLDITLRSLNLVCNFCYKIANVSATSMRINFLIFFFIAERVRRSAMGNPHKILTSSDITLK